ncbi:MAG: hypothetical protein M0Z75_15920 [Nitrospiraceae bacterium]|nr:hypothetical protein [Nitrospiraceae bacterium]
MRRAGLYDRGGSILIGLIITLVIVAIAMAATVYLTTGSSMSVLLNNNNLRAYYLAESGARFAMPLIQADLNNGNQDNMNALFGGIQNGSGKKTPTYTLSTGQFTLSVANVNATSATLTSVGSTGGKGGWLQTKRDVVCVISTTPPYPGRSNFSDLNTNWNQSTKLGGAGGLPNPYDKFIVDSKNNGLQYESTGNIKLFDTGGMITFSSSNPMVQDLAQAWQSSGTLSYQLQEKVFVDNSKSNFFMIGLSFRVDEPDTQNPPPPVSFYGISFFRKNNATNITQTPVWWFTLLDSGSPLPKNEFDSLKNDTLYMVFWEYLGYGATGYVNGKKQTCNNWPLNGCYYLLDYSPLTSVATTDGTNLLGDSTILARVIDDTSTGAHRNVISTYIAQSANSSNPYYYPAGTSNDWPPDSQFAPVSTWYEYPSGKQVSQPIIDNSLTPDMYWTTTPPYPSEVGVHVFYDQNGKNGQNGGIKDLITDFGMGMLPDGGSGGQNNQYY